MPVDAFSAQISCVGIHTLKVMLEEFEQWVKECDVGHYPLFLIKISESDCQKIADFIKIYQQTDFLWICLLYGLREASS